MALSAAAGKWRILNTAGVMTLPALNNHATDDFASGVPVVYSSGVLAACVDANTVGIDGVTAGAIPNGEVGAIYVEGLFEVGVVAGNSINFGIFDPVYTAALGVVDDGTSNDVEVGRIAPGANPAQGALTVNVVLRSRYITEDQLTHA